jgi:hypothetical protein
LYKRLSCTSLSPVGRSQRCSPGWGLLQTSRAARAAICVSEVCVCEWVTLGYADGWQWVCVWWREDAKWSSPELDSLFPIIPKTGHSSTPPQSILMFVDLHTDLSTFILRVLKEVDICCLLHREPPFSLLFLIDHFDPWLRGTQTKHEGLAWLTRTWIKVGPEAEPTGHEQVIALFRGSVFSLVKQES